MQVIDQINLSPKKEPIDEFFLKQKYIIEGMSSKEIAAITFSSRAHITTLLNRFNIPLKTTSTRRTTGPHVFGYKKHKGQSALMKREQEIIELIKGYRASGYSYQKIADFLNEQKIETKLRKGVWYSKVVRQVVTRV